MAVEDLGDRANGPTPLSAHLEFVVPAAAERLSDLRAATRAFAAQHGMAHPERAAMAVSEACTNVILHASGNGSADDVRLLCDRYEDRVVFVVDGEGRGFAPRGDGPGKDVRLPMIAGMADHVLMSDNNGSGTHTEISFALH